MIRHQLSLHLLTAAGYFFPHFESNASSCSYASLLGVRPVDLPEVGCEALQVLQDNKAGGGAYPVYDASLDIRLGIDGGDGVAEAGEPVDAAYEYVLYSPGLQVVQHAQPALRALIAAYVHPHHRST